MGRGGREGTAATRWREMARDGARWREMVGDGEVAAHLQYVRRSSWTCSSHNSLYEPGSVGACGREKRDVNWMGKLCTGQSFRAHVASSCDVRTATTKGASSLGPPRAESGSLDESTCARPEPRASGSAQVWRLGTSRSQGRSSTERRRPLPRRGARTACTGHIALLPHSRHVPRGVPPSWCRRRYTGVTWDQLHNGEEGVRASVTVGATAA